jgi:hypothetical protein
MAPGDTIPFAVSKIGEALLEHIHRRSTLDAVRQVLGEELAPYRRVQRKTLGATRRR